MTFDERNLSSGNSEADAESLGDRTRSLIGLAARVDEFLDSVGSRLVSMLDECEQTAAEKASLFNKNSELQQERNDWERQRQKDISRIRDECEQLAEAWTRLEDAERDRLGGQNGRVTQGSAQATGEPVVDASATRPSDSTINPAIIEGTAADARQVQPVGEASPVSILMQFQQLKRDIRNHAQRKS